VLIPPTQKYPGDSKAAPRRNLIEHPLFRHKQGFCYPAEARSQPQLQLPARGIYFRHSMAIPSHPS